MTTPQLISYSMVKTESFSSKMRSKRKGLILTTVIQHSTVSPGQNSEAREIFKRFQTGNEKIKLSFLASILKTRLYILVLSHAL